MNIRDYEYIVDIAAHASISRAAEELSITPGALSKYLNRIETELGIQLFIRIGGQLMPTRAGKRYVELGRLIMNLDEQLSRDIAGMIENGDAAIHLGYPRGMNSLIMESVLPDFYKKGRVEQISIERGGSRELIRLLEDGKLDLCISYVEDRIPGLHYELLSHVEPVLAVPAESRLMKSAVKRGEIPYPLLENADFLLEPYISISTVTHSGRLAEKLFSDLGQHPQVRLYTGDTDTALSAVENGIGNTILFALPLTDRMVRFLALPGMKKYHTEVCAVTRRKDAGNPGIQALIEIVRNCYKDLWK